MAPSLSSRGAALVERSVDNFNSLQDPWDPASNPDGTINLGLPENSLMCDEMGNLVNNRLRVDYSILAYVDGSPRPNDRLKKALSRFLNKHFKPHVLIDPSHIVITLGGSNAIECCAWSLCDPDDYVLVGRPFRIAYREIFGTRASVNLLEVSLGGIEPFRFEALHQLEKAYIQASKEGKRVKAILLCSPCNSLGTCLSSQVLEGYMRLCFKLDVHLICEETYALSVRKNPEIPFAPGFTSTLSINVREFMDPNMLHVVWCTSKDFGATALQIGCLISQYNGQFLKAAGKISMFDSPSRLSEEIMTSVLMDDQFTNNFISLNRSRLMENYSYVTEFLYAHNIPYRESNAAVIIWINLQVVVRDKEITDEEIVMRLLKAKVFIILGSTYASENSGWFGIVFTLPRQVLHEGLKRLIQTITDVSESSRIDGVH